MPKFIIEREIPGLGQMSEQGLQALSQSSCDVLLGMGPKTQWLYSYVTEDKLYCIYYAANEQAVREHAKRGGFPANHIGRVPTMIDPTTAEGPAASAT